MLKQYITIIIMLILAPIQVLAIKLPTQDQVHQYIEQKQYIKLFKLTTPIIEQKAKQGNIAAQALIGKLYDEGFGVPIDHVKARQYLIQASEQGNADAQNWLAINEQLYHKGEIPNYQFIRKWLEKSANQGHVEAQANLGIFYKNEPHQNLKLARQWLEKSAKNGSAKAQTQLGLLYQLGLGVKKDYAIARQWYEKAVKQNNAQAQVNLAGLYLNGKGGKTDYCLGKKLLEQSAKQNNTGAKINLNIIKTVYPFVNHQCP